LLLGQSILGLVLLYLTCGLLFGVAFVAVGVGRLDCAAQKTSVLFRVLILPGTVTFWPLLAVRWIMANKQGRIP
jgi:hypothetical protein